MASPLIIATYRRQLFARLFRYHAIMMIRAHQRLPAYYFGAFTASRLRRHTTYCFLLSFEEEGFEMGVDLHSMHAAAFIYAAITFRPT